MKEDIIQTYSKSFFDLMDKKEMNAIYEEFLAVSSILSSKEIFSFFEFQSISFEIKKNIFEKYFFSKCNILVYRFFLVLIERNRVSLVQFILEDIKKRIDDYNNVQKVYIRSSEQIDQEHLEKIKDIMKEKLNQDIELEFVSDKNVNKGFILVFKDYLIDCSLTRKFKNIKNFLFDIKIDWQKGIV